MPDSLHRLPVQLFLKMETSSWVTTMADAPDALDARINAASLGNVRDTAPKEDTSYKREWNRFKGFVDSTQYNQQLPHDDKCLTRNKMLLYFTTADVLLPTAKM